MTTTTDIDSNATSHEQPEQSGPATTNQCTCHKFIRLHDGDCDVHGRVRKQLVDDDEDACSRTNNCENCHAPTSFERRDPTTQPPEGEVCEQCQAWLCPDCVHPIGEPCPPVAGRDKKPAHTLSNFRVEYVKPDYSRGHSFEPRCAILADDAALGGVEVRVFDVPDPDESQREIAQFVCKAMNEHGRLRAAAQAALDNLYERSLTRKHWSIYDQKVYEQLDAALNGKRAGTTD